MGQIQGLGFYEGDYELKNATTIKRNLQTSKDPADQYLWVLYSKQSTMGKLVRNGSMHHPVTKLVREGSAPVLIKYLAVLRANLSDELPEDPSELEKVELSRFICSELESRIRAADPDAVIPSSPSGF